MKGSAKGPDAINVFSIRQKAGITEAISPML